MNWREIAQRYHRFSQQLDPWKQINLNIFCVHVYIFRYDLSKNNKDLKQQKEINFISKFQRYQKDKMKAQNRRALQGGMKSPSPDIANRSIITNTKSPANEIKEYIRMRESSPSPQNMAPSFHQISKSSPPDNEELNRLKRYIQELETKIKLMERIKISHQQLTMVNQRLGAENAQLKQELREQPTSSQRNISPSNGRAPSPKVKGVSLVRNSLQNINPEAPQVPLSGPSDNILRQFNERIVKMSDENKRLGKKLKEINDQKDHLEKQNNMLKTSKYQQPNMYSSASDNDFLKRYFVEEADKIAKYYQRLNENKIAQLNGRLIELQEELARVLQKQSQRRVFNRTNSPHELKANISVDTQLRSDNQDEHPSSLQPNRYGMAESKYTTSPSEFKTQTFDTSPIRALEEEKDKIRRQNDILSRKAFELQNQLKNTLLECSRLEKRVRLLQSEAQNKRPMQESGLSVSKLYQQKNESLQHELATKSTELRFKVMRIEQLQKQLQQLNTFRQKESQNYDRIIAQQKQKNLHYLSEIQQYGQRFNQLQQNYLERQRFDQLENQLQTIQKQYHQMKINLQKYLEMVLEIRHSITGEDVETCLQQVEMKWGGYDELELEIIKIHEGHQAVIQNFKKNILEKDQRIAQLEKENQLLQQSTQQTKLQLEKLQKAIFQYNQPVKTNISQEELKRRMNMHQSASKNRQPCKIRDYINNTVSKISDLENQIDSAIKQHRTTQKIPSSKDYFTPVQADSAFRGSTNLRGGEREVREYSGDQVESDVEQIPDEHDFMPRR